jgi:hypothetical protein
LRGLPGTGGNSSTILPAVALGIAAFSAATTPPASASTMTRTAQTENQTDFIFMGIPETMNHRRRHPEPKKTPAFKKPNQTAASAS